jgi:CheY-like chemotaxis protein
LAEGDPQQSTDLDGLHILVVDDEPDAREVIGRILARAGADVVCCGSVRDGLGAAMRRRPDVIISDIAMPEQDGYDLIRVLREMALDAPPIPTLALTAYAREEDRLRALSAGFTAYLAKPVDPTELLEVVAHLALPSAAPSTR